MVDRRCGRLLVAEVDAGDDLACADRDLVGSRCGCCLVPAGLGNLGDGVGAGDQVREGVVAVLVRRREALNCVMRLLSLITPTTDGSDVMPSELVWPFGAVSWARDAAITGGSPGRVPGAAKSVLITASLKSGLRSWTWSSQPARLGPSAMTWVRWAKLAAGNEKKALGALLHTFWGLRARNSFEVPFWIR